MVIHRERGFLARTAQGRENVGRRPFVGTHPTGNEVSSKHVVLTPPPVLRTTGTSSQCTERVSVPA
jgi:hypothetical protein